MPIPRDPPFDVERFSLGWALFLLPIGLGILLVASTLRVLAGALPWIILWLTGFFVGGAAGRLLVAFDWWSTTVEQSWAIAGGGGMILLSGLHGIATAWLAWAVRHDVSPYPGYADTSAEDEAFRQRFALRLRMPALFATTVAGTLPAMYLMTWGTADVTGWLIVPGWAVAGALGLAAEGIIMGAALGWVRQRDPNTAFRSSLGEAFGQRLAGQSTGPRGALGWAVGYALCQLPVGTTAGAIVGLATRFVL